jgi:GxxExxY protein
VAHEVVVEIKSIARLPDVALAQVLSYLRTANLERELLLNFGSLRMVDGVKTNLSVISVASVALLYS